MIATTAGTLANLIAAGGTAGGHNITVIGTDVSSVASDILDSGLSATADNGPSIYGRV